jgi:hypothetical protein
LTETGMLPEATSSCLPIVGDSAHFLWQGPHRFVANQISRCSTFISIIGCDWLPCEFVTMTFGFVIVVIFPAVPCYGAACMVMNWIAYIIPIFKVIYVIRFITMLLDITGYFSSFSNNQVPQKITL